MNYSEKSFVISTHVFATGPAQDLREFLLKNGAKSILYIGHPLFHDKRLKGSGYENYESGEKVKEYYKKLPSGKISLWDYSLHVLRSVWWVLRSGQVFDLYIGSDDVNATAGVILKKLGKVKKTVYYVIDYNPYRFKSKIMNFLYHWVDRFCVRNSDETWNLSPRMEQARKDYFDFTGGNQKVVPIGVWLDRIHPKPPEEIEKHTAVFMGHITKKQGVQKIINAMPEILKEVPDFRFLVIGDGEYLPELRDLSQKLGVAKHVEFTGYVEDSAQVEEMITRCAVAVALYDKYDDDGHLTFTYFADPAKVKMYLACGLYVLTSEFVLEMDQYQNSTTLMGMAEGENFAAGLTALIRTDPRLQKAETHKMSERFNWGALFEVALGSLL